MYKDSKRTCTAIVLLIKPFVWWRSRRRRRRGLLNSLIFPHLYRPGENLFCDVTISHTWIYSWCAIKAVF